MKRTLIAFSILCMLCSAGCVDQSPELVHLQSAQETAFSSPGAVTVDKTTPAPTATPEPIVLSFPEITGIAFPNDALGIPIVNADTHYAEYYIRYSQIRIYEVGESTFADMLVDNSFSLPLTGEARLVFTGEDGKVYGYGELETADGTLTLNVGKNYVYAEILTEVDVQMMAFAIDVITPYTPVSAE